MKRRIVISSLMVLLFSMVSQTATAETTIDVESFKPSPFGNDLFLTNLGETRNEELKLNVGLIFNYQHNPLVLNSGDDFREVIGNRLTADVLAALAITRWFEVGIGLPVLIFQDGEGLPDQGTPSSGGLGDFRLYTKFRLFQTSGGLFTLGFVPYITLPIGKQIDQFAGAAGVTVVPMLAGSFDLDRFGFALNLGYRFLEKQSLYNQDFDDEILVRAGAWLWLAQKSVQAIAEINTATLASNAFAGGESTPMELRVGGRYFPKQWIQLNLGVGTGLTSGYATPDFRVFAGAMVELPPSKPVEPPNDTDGDGIFDYMDPCMLDAEDLDDFEDLDGCPDADNDGDNVLDADDKCPDELEDIDTFADEDGCPDPDNDNDGFLDTDDNCPNEAEDKDGFQDDDGCPDLDNDGDGVLDTADKCPEELETMNGIQDDDGCADQKVTVTEDKIVILEKIYFELNKATIKQESFALLDEIAEILKAHPEIKRVLIEGHSDSKGTSFLNKKLSSKRAAAVRKYLVNKGIYKNRLKAKGFGSTKPLVTPEATEADYEKNRRVEFSIKKRIEKMVETKAEKKAPKK